MAFSFPPFCTEYYYLYHFSCVMFTILIFFAVSTTIDLFVFDTVHDPFTIVSQFTSWLTKIDSQEVATGKLPKNNVS